MALAQFFAPILAPFVEKYKLANTEKERSVIVDNAAAAVTKSRDDNEENRVKLPKDMKKVRLFNYLAS
jgi:hypothetical protein